MTLSAIVLAAGKGTRMNSDLAKVLHEVAGRPMVNWVVEHLDAAGCDDIVVVIGHQADVVAAVLPEGVATAHQHEQRGTGHAAGIGMEALDADVGDTVVVISGDMPLISSESLAALVATHAASDAPVTFLSAVLDEPRAYGRVVRDGLGAVTGIVEERDATPQERAIREVNTSVYAFDASFLRAALGRLRPDNDQGELYLTDTVAVAAADGHRPVAVIVDDPAEAFGVNTVEQLAEVSEKLIARLG